MKLLTRLYQTRCSEAFPAAFAPGERSASLLRNALIYTWPVYVIAAFPEPL
jgi:hypothetical protein